MAPLESFGRGRQCLAMRDQVRVAVRRVSQQIVVSRSRILLKRCGLSDRYDIFALDALMNPFGTGYPRIFQSARL